MRRAKTPLGLAVLVVVQGLVFGIFRWLLSLLPLPDRLGARWQWALRRSFWNNLARLKFQGSKPQSFPIPGGAPRPIAAVDFARQFPGIPVRHIKVADRIPWDEMRGRNFFKDWPHKILMRVFTRFQVFMYWWLAPMQARLDEIDPDPYAALAQAYPKGHRALFEPPVMPLEFQGSLDLGALAVKGPYHGYLWKYDWGKDALADKCWDIGDLMQDADLDPKWEEHWAQWGRFEDNLYQWDFRSLDKYDYHDELNKLGCRVLFSVDREARRVRPIRIQSELGISKLGDQTWEFTKKLALCAATTHLSLVSHFNGIHLASGAHLAIATRNHLCSDHVLGRLLWPYVYHTPLSNRLVTLAQMAEGGDFESIFSFTHQGMCDLFSETYPQFDFAVNDPEADAQRRGIVQTGFETPTQDDLQDLFDVFRRQAGNYLDIYYNGNNAVLQKDEPVLKWLDALNDPETGIPNGLRIHGGTVTRGNVTLTSLARLLAGFMYLVTVRHDLEGSFLWNYQLWAHKQPPRLYRDGRRLPLDVYLRLVNANFNLNVPRTPLMWEYLEEDWSYLASAQCGQQPEAMRVWREFQQDLERLEQEWRTREPWHVWRVYPSLLEVNIND